MRAQRFHDLDFALSPPNWAHGATVRCETQSVTLRANGSPAIPRLAESSLCSYDKHYTSTEIQLVLCIYRIFIYLKDSLYRIWLKRGEQAGTATLYSCLQDIPA